MATNTKIDPLEKFESLTEEQDRQHEFPHRRGLGIRHLQVAVMAVTAFLGYTLRTNLSLAIVAMVDKGNDTDTPTNSSIPTYDWNEKIQGYVLSSFFWGYVITQIPAGLLSSRFGGHRFLCAGFLISAVLSLALPQCAYIGGWGLVCVNRMLQGISQGMIFPSIYSLLGLWVPPSERSLLASITVSAQLLGTVVSTPVTGFLTSAYGWPSVFYFFGATGAVFGVIMLFLGADSPAKHRMISYSEKTYIQTSLGGGAKVKRRVPWMKVVTSAPYLSAMFGHAFHGAVFITFLTKIPTFLGTVLKFSIADNGLATALPYLASWILSYAFSLVCNFLIGRGMIHLTTARKLFNSIAHFGGAVFIVLLAHADGDVLPVVYLTCVMGLQAGVYLGIQSTFVDLAPNFSGAIFSLSNCVSNCLGVAGPNIVGFIVTDKGSASQWRIVFYLCAILLVISNIVFMIWGTSDTQYWNWPEIYKNKSEYNKSKKESELQKEDVPVRRYSLHGAELME